jgi:UDP-3-O-[3-hydroxymyristoyl] glucosamine N-acyltransferase
MEIPLSKLSDMIDGEVVGDGNIIIRGVAPFEQANKDEITYAGSQSFLKKIGESNAGAIIVPKEFKSKDNGIVKADNPRVAFAKVVNIFHAKANPEPGINKTAHIGKNFRSGQNVSIGPFVVVGDNVVFGDNVKIHAHVFLGDNVTIGDDVEIYPNVTVFERCKLGNRVIIYSGTVIGSDGFGFAPDGERYCKVPQIGIVQIDDDVEIGANNAIDRATFGRTWIQKGVKTDNLVHIAHNVTVGENTLLIAQVGISGSVSIGNHSILAGQAGVIDHMTIGDNVTIGPKAGVVKSIPSGEAFSGFTPAMPHRLFLKVQSIVLKLPELKKKIDGIEKKLEKILGDKM